MAGSCPFADLPRRSVLDVATADLTSEDCFECLTVFTSGSPDLFVCELCGNLHSADRVGSCGYGIIHPHVQQALKPSR